MTLAASVDWTNVIVALIAGVPAIIAAVGVLLANAKLQTPSGTPIGRQVEAAHHTAIANNQRLVSINEKIDAPTSPLGNDEESHVPKLVENGQGNGEGH